MNKPHGILAALATLAFAAALGSAVIAAAPAKPPVATPAEPSVDKIVADYITARGGLAKIRSVNTLRQKGRASEGPGRDGLVVRELKRPGKSRFEFTIQGVTGVFVANNGQGWQVSPFDGDMSVKPMSQQAVTDAMEQADIEGPLVDWKAKGHKVELAGHETVAGHDTYKLKVTLKSGAIRYDYIDVKTHYELRVDSTREIRGRPAQIQMLFDKHTMTSGVLFPGEIEISAAERPNKLRIVVESVEVNPAIADARFERSKSSK